MTPSPCVGICRLDAGGRVCTGCGRSLEEIAAWSGMTEAERLAVWTRLAEASRAEGGSVCAQCGKRFACGSGGPEGACWCAAYPSIAIPADLVGCLCPGCLAAYSPAKAGM